MALEMTATSIRGLRRIPAPVVDAGLAVAMAVTVTITIAVSPGPGRRPDALAYGLGLTIAALLLAWRRWPLAVLLGSVVILQLYYVLNYPGIFPAMPLSVALCAAWTAGHQRWALLVAVWFLGVPVAYRVVAEQAPPLRVLGDEMPDAALLAALLLLAEAIRSRRALALEQQRSEQLLLNVLPAPIADRLKAGEGVIADAFPEVTVLFADIVDFTGHSQHVSPQQVVQAQRAVLGLRSARPAPWPGEDQDHWRRLHGGRRPPRPAARPRPGGRRDGPGDA
jgi:hypothetical protein